MARAWAVRSVISRATPQGLALLVTGKTTAASCGSAPMLPENDVEITREMREAYNAGRYKFKVPPVCTYYWDADDWIRFINAHGGFNCCPIKTGYYSPGASQSGSAPGLGTGTKGA